MTEKKIDIEDAVKEVELVSKRLALLHLAYAKTLTEELGEEQGKELVLKSIKRYGRWIGEKRREETEDKGLEPTPENFSKGNKLRIPRFGMHSKLDGAGDSMKLYGCAMGKLWREYGEEELGRLYCYVDPAKYMGFNEDYIQIHKKAMPAGDECCEFMVRKSTKKEKELFKSEDEDFSEVDEHLNCGKI